MLCRNWEVPLLCGVEISVSECISGEFMELSAMVPHCECDF